MGTERMGRLMRQYAIPCIISLLVGALYNIVDQIFIANASYLGSYGNAANTVVFPLTVVALAIAVMVGDGCCAFVSMALGRSEIGKAKRSVGNAVVLSVAGGLVLTAVYLVFADSIIAMFGGTVNEETFRCSQEYFFYITLGIPFYMFGQAMNPIIRADGNPKFAMVSTLAGAVVNIILDPIFIFCFKWGMMGAAVATVIGQVATAALAVWYLLHMKIIKPASGDYALRGNICGQTLTLGITSFLSQISLVAAMAAINNMLRQYGALDPVFGQAQYAQTPMAVVGIVTLALALVLGEPVHLPTSGRTWAAALFLGIFCSGVAFVIQSVQQQYTTASHVGLIFTLEPVFASMVAFVMTGEVLSLRGYIGAALMLLSLFIMEGDWSFLGRKKRV